MASLRDAIEKRQCDALADSHMPVAPYDVSKRSVESEDIEFCFPD